MDTSNFTTQSLYSRYPELCRLEMDWHCTAMMYTKIGMITSKYEREDCLLVMRYIEKVLSWVETHNNLLEDDAKLLVGLLRHEAEVQYDVWSSRSLEPSVEA